MGEFDIKMGAELVFLFNNIPRVVGGLPRTVSYGIDRQLLAMENYARANAPFELGALSASVYRITPSKDDYEQRVADMLSIRPNLEPVDPPEINIYYGEAALGAAAPYAGYVHDGHMSTGGTWVPGDPFMQDAIDQYAGSFGDTISAAIEKLAETGIIPIAAGEE